MDLLIVLGALVFLMLVAYRGYSVILFAPVAALGAVLLTEPSLVAPMFSSVFMEKMVGFVKSYFPVFMLGAVFGKVIELSGFSKSIVAAVIGLVGRERAMLSIVLVCAILTYGGVSLFVVVFAVYPFAAEMFRQSGIPKRLIPCTVASARSPSRWMRCPVRRRTRTSFRRPSSRRRPGPRRGWGSSAARSSWSCGLLYIEAAAGAAQAAGEGYGTNLRNEPEAFEARSCRTRGSPFRPGSSRGDELRPHAAGAAILRSGSRVRAERPDQADRHARSARWRLSGRSKARCCWGS